MCKVPGNLRQIQHQLKWACFLEQAHWAILTATATVVTDPLLEETYNPFPEEDEQGECIEEGEAEDFSYEEDRARPESTRQLPEQEAGVSRSSSKLNHLTLYSRGNSRPVKREEDEEDLRYYYCNHHVAQPGHDYRDARGFGLQAHCPVQGFDRLHGLSHQLAARGQRYARASGLF
jgi:hypothetical protein